VILSWTLSPGAVSRGEVCERFNRSWICVEVLEWCCQAALGRFVRDPKLSAKPLADPLDASNYYRIRRPSILWNGHTGDTLPKDGGRKRQLAGKAKRQEIAVVKVNGHKTNGHAHAPVNGAYDVSRSEEAHEFRLVEPPLKRQSSRAAKN